MKLKTLLTVGMMTLAAGLMPEGVEAAPVAVPTAVPVNAAAFAPGAVVQVAPVVVVERRRRQHRRRRVVYRRGVRRVIYY